MAYLHEKMFSASTRLSTHAAAALLSGALLALAACGDAPPEQARAANKAETIIRQAALAHGGQRADGVKIEFDFREYHYSITLDGEFFQYERERPDSAGYIRDVLNNDGFYREIDGERVRLSREADSSYASSLNAVSYFMLLPFKLTDEAVQARYLSEEEILGEPYHEIEVTFHQEGGGDDYQDRYVYWFHRDRLTMDYLAYDYETNNPGTRFRQAYNARIVGGVRFQDYLNFTSGQISRPGDPIERMDSLLHIQELDTVSVIEKTNVVVEKIGE